MAYAWATLTFFGLAAPARAQQPAPCANDRIQVEAGLGESWQAAVQALCKTLPGWQDVDASARLRITPSGTGVILEVTTSDGRAALRRVYAPEDLELGVEALMTVPTKEPVDKLEKDATPAPAPVAAPTALAAPAAQQPVAAQPSAQDAANAAAARSLSIEVGGAFLARVEGSPTYLCASLELSAGWWTGAWLLALQARWSPVQVALHAPNGLEMQSVGAGFLLARRVYHESGLDLDLGANVVFLAESQSYQVGTGPESTDTDADLRVGFAPRLVFGDPGLRYAIVLEADVSPPRMVRSVHVAPELPALPSWGIGLGMSVAWEQL